ncbi:glycosyltransferase [bacterium]|nr:glycosyltransferase [bacterium]
MTCVGILHYAGPPGIGGVEVTMYHHARGLAALGYTVRVISGHGQDFDARIHTVVEPLLNSTHPDVLAAKRSLDQGQIPPNFDALVERMVTALDGALAGCTVCIAHNVPTLNKNLPLSVALAQYVVSHPTRLLAWCHDLAWTNPQYLPELHDGYPWDVLREPWPDATYVTVSEPRRHEVAQLLGIPSESVVVAVPGVDPAEFYHWTPTTAYITETLNLLDADGLLLLPARLTRRKNVAFGLRVLKALRQISGRDFRLIVTGPPGPHNPTNPGYLGELLALRDELHLNESAHFLYALGEGSEPLVPDNSTIANLYHMADALFFPSLQEGFGIPVVEAGFAGLPVFCADIPPFHSTGQSDVHYFDPRSENIAHIAGQILDALETDKGYRLRVRMRQQYRWSSLIRDVVVPLVEQR